MANFSWMFGFEISLLTACLIGDHLTFRPPISDFPQWFQVLIKAVFDSSTHGIIAALSWFTVRRP